MNYETLPHNMESKRITNSADIIERAEKFLEVMRRLGLLDDAPLTEDLRKDWPDIAAIFADSARPEFARYIPRQYHTAFDVLDCALSLTMRFSGAAGEAAGRDEAPGYQRPPELLIRRLRYRLALLHGAGGATVASGRRLLRLGLTALVRTMAHIEPPLNRKLYRFLRTGKRIPRVPHDEMFLLLPDHIERLALLNFLYKEGRFKADRFLRTYQRHFNGAQLRFAGNGPGFTLGGPPAEATSSPRAKYAAAMLKSADKWNAILAKT